MSPISSCVENAIVDATAGTAGALLMAWFIAAIWEEGRDPDSMNLAAVIGAVLGALILVSVFKVVRGQ